MATLAVKDANILIDCSELDLVGEVLALAYTFVSTDLVWQEITDPADQVQIQPFIDNGKLQLFSFEAEALEEISNRNATEPGLSLEDCSVWFLAEQEGAILLTGDKKLRKVATQGNIEVHGMLWVLQKLYDQQLLDQTTACQKLRQLQQLNPRLPQAVIQKMENDWCTADPNT